MTVALGLVCADGVVVASDSQGTSENDTASLAVKVQAIDQLPAVWTASGTVYCIEEVAADTRQWHTDARVRNAFRSGDFDGIRVAIASKVGARLKAAYQSALPMGERQVIDGRHTFHTSFLFLGWAGDKPWFLEFDGSGQLNWHTDTRFKAVGSGGAFADVAGAVMYHLVEQQDLSLEWGCKVAYRAVETTCNISAGMVSLPVQLGVVNSDGARIFTREEVQEVEHAVGGWRQLERDIVHGDASPAAETEEPPTLEEE